MKSYGRLKKTTGRTKPQQSKILILTASIGRGHVSVARAVESALYRLNASATASADKSLRIITVETVDFLDAFANIATKATKNIYLGSLKISPKIYELIFSQTEEFNWPLKLLNMLSAPFMQQKFMKLLREKQPAVLVSTMPVWDIFIRKMWKKYIRGKNLSQKMPPFVSIITDSMNVHSAWMTGQPDYFIVPNEDTYITLRNFGIKRKKIKKFGYPVAHKFFKHGPCRDFQTKWNLSPKKKTLLLIFSLGMQWSRVKKITNAIQYSKHKNLQLVIVAGTNEKWRKKLERCKWPWPTRITGCTNEMHEFIHGSDIVLTKAGGATVMECINSKKPLIIIDALPGQEIGNAMLVQKYNLGVVLDRNVRNFDDAIEYILKNEEFVKKNLANMQTPRAAENIARFLMRLAA